MRGLSLLLHFLADNVVAEFNAFIANIHRRAGNQLAHLMLALAAERAVQQLAAVLAFTACFVHHLLVTSEKAGNPVRVETLWGFFGAASIARPRNVGVSRQDSVPSGLDGALFQYRVYEAVFDRLLPAHETIPLRILLHSFDSLAGMPGHDGVQPLPQVQDFPGMDIDIGGL